MIFIWMIVVVSLWAIVIGLYLIVKINAARIHDLMDAREDPVRLAIEVAGDQTTIALVVAGAFAIAATVPLVVAGVIWLASHFGWRESLVAGFTLGSAGIFGYLWWRNIRSSPIPSGADGAPKKPLWKDLPGMDTARKKR